MSRYPQQHCGGCGRFAPWGADTFTPYGGALDVDPPEPVPLCRRCCVEDYRKAVRDRRLPSHWIPARWEYRAAKKIGFVRAGPKGAAWAHWFAPSAVPAGYEVFDEPGGVSPTRGESK